MDPLDRIYNDMSTGAKRATDANQPDPKKKKTDGGPPVPSAFDSAPRPGPSAVPPPNRGGFGTTDPFAQRRAERERLEQERRAQNQQQAPPPQPQAGGGGFGSRNPFADRQAARQAQQNQGQNPSHGQNPPQSQGGFYQGGHGHNAPPPHRGGYDRGYDNRGSRGGQDRGGYGGGHRGGYGNRNEPYVKEEKPSTGYQDRGGHQERRYGGFNQIGRETKPFGGGSSNRSPTQELEVQLNALTVSAKTESVRRFHVTMIKTMSSGKQKDVTITPKNDQAAQFKETTVYATVAHILESNRDIFGSKYQYVYDGGPTIYTCNFQIGTRFNWNFSKEEVENNFPSQVSEGLGALKNYEVIWEETGELIISGPKFNPSDPSREANKFYDVICSAFAKEGQFLNYSQKSFPKAEERTDVPLPEAKVIKQGLEKTTKVIGTDGSNAKLLLQVNSKATAFKKSLNMVDFLLEFLGVHRIEQAFDMIKRERSVAHKVQSELKNMFVVTNHTKRVRSFSIKGLDSEKTPNTHFLINKEGVKMSIAEYFQATYGIRLRYPNGPMAVEEYPNKEPSYHPIEVIKMADGQRVGTGKLGKNAEEVHKQSRLLPHEKKDRAMCQLEKIRLVNAENPYLEAFKIFIDRDFIRTKACLLQEPRRAGYNNATGKGRRFYQAAKVQQPIIVVPLDKCMSENRAREFWAKIESEGRRQGMQLPRDAKIVDARSELHLPGLFEEWSKSNPRPAMVIFITKIKMDDAHHLIKYLELQRGVQSQHLSLQTVDKMLQGGGGAATIENVLRKLNPKLGGVNDQIQPGPGEPEDSKKYLQDRMFVGLELSHPDSQNLFDRQNNIQVSSPTIVGLSFSLDIPERLNGFFWYQNPRIYKITKLCENFSKALEIHRKKTGRLPPELVIYRHGASEGDRQHIKGEIEEIQDACRQKGCNPKIVFMLCIANSGTTCMPVNLPRPEQRVKARDVNVASGTVMDTGIEDAGVPTFYIKSQESNIGTSHMNKVIVERNDGQISLRELEKVTHWTAFAHSASTMPTAKPHVLYAANELAKRGNNHYKQDQNQFNEDASSYVSQDSKDEAKEDETTAYWEKKSFESRISFEHQFWA